MIEILRKVLMYPVGVINESEQTHLKRWVKLWDPANYSAKRICVDFDGVISDYSDGWKNSGHIGNSKIVAGAVEFLNKAISQDYEVLIYSARCNSAEGRKAIEVFLIDNGIKINDYAWKITLMPGKPPAQFYLDDRALRFEGKFLSPDEYIAQNPWYYKGDFRQNDYCPFCKATYDRLILMTFTANGKSAVDIHF